MKDRIPTKPGRKGYVMEASGLSASSTAADIVAFLQAKFYGVESWEDEPTEVGTAINKIFGDSSWFVTFTHTKSGTNHELTNADGGNIIRFVATANFSVGDTFTVNGASVTAKLYNGSPLQNNAFVSGSVVLCALNNGYLYFPSSGQSITSGTSEPTGGSDGDIYIQYWGT